jgi:hypothetical protein
MRRSPPLPRCRPLRVSWPQRAQSQAGPSVGSRQRARLVDWETSIQKSCVKHVAQQHAVLQALARRLHHEDDEHLLAGVDPKGGAAGAAPVEIAGELVKIYATGVCAPCPLPRPMTGIGKPARGPKCGGRRGRRRATCRTAACASASLPVVGMVRVKQECDPRTPRLGQRG